MKALSTCRAAAAPSSMRSLPLSAQPPSVLPFLAKAGSPRICRNRKPSAEIKSAQDVLDDSLMDAMGLSQLQRRTVLKPSRHRYLKAWRTFVASSKVKVGRLAAKRLDKMMVTFFDVAFLRGEEADLGRDVLAAAAFLHPDAPKPQGKAFPEAVRALKGWHRTYPPKARLPLPWEGVCWIALEALMEDEMQIALLLLLVFVFFLRPSEGFRVRACDLIEPCGMIKFWTLILHPEEMEVPSKTGEHDEALQLQIAQFRFVCETIFRLLVLPMANKSQPLFTITAAEVNAFLRRTEVKHKLSASVKTLHLYRFRHAGPSVAAAAGLMPQGDIMKMGRWKSLRSLRRYEKGGRVAQVLAAFPKHLGVMEAEKALRRMLSRLTA
jgi:hypothetical protein